MSKYFDFIIVGQGLAGSMMAFRLHEAGYRCLVIDETSGATASRQATGLINPITGRRFVKSWLTDELMAEARVLYEAMERKFGKKLLKNTSIKKIVASVEQLNDLEAKLNEKEYSEYLGEKIEYADPKMLHNPHGTIEIKKVMQVAIVDLQNCIENLLSEEGMLLKSVFDFESLVVKNDGFEYLEFSCNKLIFCEGFNVFNNKFFNYLPNRVSKGEALVIECKELAETQIISGACNITPIGNHVFYAGATYDWSDNTMQATEAKKIELEAKINETIALPFTILQHKVGVRPTVLDRRPLLGEHPLHKNMFIFNGFGTKGLSLCPYFSLQFVNYLLEKETIHPEVDIKRFESKYYA